MIVSVGTRVRILEVLEGSAHYDQRHLIEGSEGTVYATLASFKGNDPTIVAGGVTIPYYHRFYCAQMRVKIIPTSHKKGTPWYKRC